MSPYLIASVLVLLGGGVGHKIDKMVDRLMPAEAKLPTTDLRLVPPCDR